MSDGFGVVTVIGVGLMGGSLGLALKARGLASCVRGVGHRRSSLDKALEVGAVDTATLDPREAATGADLVVLCTPASLVCPMLDQLRAVCSPNTVVTDVASTKAQICEHARETWPAPLRFVGSHPMAGSERFGPQHADADLYEGCVTLVAEGADLDAQAQETVTGLWRSVGAEVVRMAPVAHDAIVARTSHLPHIAAACLAALAARASEDPKHEVRPLAGPGFRDVTRIASGRPEVWRDICLTNRGALLDALDQLAAQMGAIREALANEDGERLEAFFRGAGEARREVLDE